MGIPTKERDELPYTGLMFCQTSSQEVLQTEPITDITKESFFHNKGSASVMRVGDTILAAAEEARIDEYLCLIDNQST